MKFTRPQIRVLCALTLAYTCGYICRTHISMLLPSLMEAFSLTQAQGGLIATLFAVVYACGQLVVGLVVDRVNPRACILSGLVIASAANFGCSLAPSYEWILALWTLNAIGQSMLWTPVVRILALTYQDAARERASFILSLILVLAYVAAWLLAGLITSYIGWRQAFAVPAGVTLAGGLCAYCMLRGTKAAPAAHAAAAPQEKESAKMPLGRVMLSTGLFLVLIGSVCNGFMRDSIMNWAPTILVQTQGLALDGVLGVALIIPLVNELGILFGRQCYRWFRMDARRCTAAMLLMGSATSLLLFLLPHVHVGLLGALLALTAATAYGLNPMITTLLPLEYDRLRLVGTVAGMVDAAIYLGSGLAGILAGAVAQSAGWQAVFALWCASGVAGATLILLSARERYRKNL